MRLAAAMVSVRMATGMAMRVIGSTTRARAGGIVSMAPLFL